MAEATSKKRGLPMRVKMRHDTHFVEELTTRHETPVGRMVPLSSVQPDPNQPRSAMGDLDDLVASIRDKGVLEPILVRPIGGSPADEPEGPAALPFGGPRDDAGEAASYRIISGERRYRAAQEAGLYEVPAIVLDVSEEEALEIALIENLQRKDLTPFEEALGYQALIERHGYTHERVAEAVGKARTVVTESLALLQMPPRVRQTVQALGIESRSLLLEVLKADSEDEMLRLLEEVSRQGLNRDDLRRRMRNRERASGGRRRKPYTFKFRAPDKTYTLSLAFRQSEVDRDDLMRALEEILAQLRAEAGK
ncbi:MAG TPA: ParB/RepB/Spo0J family partition protein [Thermoanaerobaculia bacterium]|nr:ParB/RepB/Spo0J family partition protein [Thermoanaerobaculia bacterium]